MVEILSIQKIVETHIKAYEISLHMLGGKKMTSDVKNEIESKRAFRLTVFIVLPIHFCHDAKYEFELFCSE